MIKAICLNAQEIHKIDLMTDQWNFFLDDRRKRRFEFATGDNWLTVNEREYMLGESLKLLNRIVSVYAKD